MTRIRQLHLSRGRLSALGVLVLASLVVVSATAVFGSDSRTPTPALPVPGYSDAAPCRADTLAHVHDPSRLVVVAPCATLQGTVKAVNWQPTDADTLVELTLDPSYARFVPAGSRSVFVNVIPSDVSVVTLPKAGDRIAASGAWVRNRNQAGRLELHPAWDLRQLNHTVGSSRLSPADPPVDARLTLPHRVKVGDSYTLRVDVTSKGTDGAEPVALAHVWLEIVSGGGRAVQWKAAASNSLGMAALELVALYRPGSYDTNIYVERQGRVVVLHERLEVVP